MIQQASWCGVSTRRVDQLVESLGLRISRSEVSRVCEALEEPVEAFRTRPLEGRCPYRSSMPGWRRSKTAAGWSTRRSSIAHGVHETSSARSSPSMSARPRPRRLDPFLRGLVKRGLVGVQLAISRRPRRPEGRDRQGPGLRLAALHRAFPARLLRPCPQGPARPAGRADPPDLHRRRLEQARDQLSEAVAHLNGWLGRIASMLEDAEVDILACYTFPPSHWRKLRSTNPLERFNKERRVRITTLRNSPCD